MGWDPRLRGEGVHGGLYDTIGIEGGYC